MLPCNIDNEKIVSAIERMLLLLENCIRSENTDMDFSLLTDNQVAL